MIKLDSGNVLLKPSHRKQLMTWLKRSLKLGERLGDFVLKIRMQRVGHAFEVHATVHDSIGDFGCRSRQGDWKHAVRQLIRTLKTMLHSQQLRLAAG